MNGWMDNNADHDPETYPMPMRNDRNLNTLRTATYYKAPALAMESIMLTVAYLIPAFDVTLSPCFVFAT